MVIMPLATPVLSRTDIAEPMPTPAMPPSDNTNATRHLSAGAYIDPEFCLTALHEVYYKPKRVVAPSYGFDAITVLGHCLRARRAMVIRDAILLGLLLLASWVSLFAVLAVLLTLMAVHLLLVVGQVSLDSLRYLRATPREREVPDGEEDRRRRATRQRRAPGAQVRPWSRGFRRLWFENVVAQIIGRVVGVAFAYAVFLAVGAVLATWLWQTGLLGHTRFGLDPSLATGVLLASVFGTAAAARAWNRYQLRALVPGSVPRPPVNTHRLADIKAQDGGNTTIYSGYQPFVGSGDVLRWWTLAQRLVRPLPPTPKGDDNRTEATAKDRKLTEAEREFETPPFRAPEISEYVRNHIAGLARDPVPERHLSDLTVVDRIFVAGTEVSSLRPVTPHKQVERIIRHPTAPQRHYLACQIVSWRGELVTTVYVHFAVQGKVLYVELHVAGLLPCDEEYRVVDQVDGTSLAHVLRDAGKGLFTAPAIVASAPASLARACVDMLHIAFAIPSATARLKRGYDYGATVGLREIGESTGTRDHMQTQDIIKYGRMIERRVLDAILDFLEDRGVDVTEYRQRSLTILNAGAVATSGGTVIVGGDAVGTQNNTEGGGG
jgi:hypothetical protein